MKTIFSISAVCCYISLWTINVYAKGFLQIESVVQPRLQIEVGSPAFDSTQMNWNIHRAVIELSSGMESKLGFCISADLSEGNVLKDAYVKYSPFKIINLCFGRAKPSFGYDMQKDPEELMLIANSRASSFIREVARSTRNTGLAVSGIMPLNFQYEFGYYDSPNNSKESLFFAPLFNAQVGWSIFDGLRLFAGFRTESFRQHHLLQYRTSFYDFALISELFNKRWYSEIELFYGDATLRDYLLEWDDKEPFVTASLRVLSGFSFKLAKQILTPVVSVEHFDDGFKTAQVYTGGLRWETSDSFILNLDGEFTFQEKSDMAQDRKVSVQGTYVFRKGW